MAVGVKISQLLDGSTINSADYFPVARGGIDTFKLAAKQLVTGGLSLSGGSGDIFAGTSVGNSTTLQFRTLSANGEGITISTTGNTVNFSISALTNCQKTTFTSNGTSTTYGPIVGANSINPSNYRVDIDGVLQEPIADYTTNTPPNITFTSIPPLSSKIVIVTNTITNTYDSVPSDNSVTTNKIALTAVTNDKLAANSVGTLQLSAYSVTADKIAPNSIGVTQLSGGAITTASIAASAITAEKMSGGQTGSAPVYGCRAWVTFTGLTYTNVGGENRCALSAAGNISKVVRTYEGSYTLYFTTPMPDINYAVTGLCTPQTGTNNPAWVYNFCSTVGAAYTYEVPTLSSFKIVTCRSTTGGGYDPASVTISVPKGVSLNSSGSKNGTVSLFGFQFFEEPANISILYSKLLDSLSS